MKQFTIEELKTLKNELLLINKVNSTHVGVIGIGIGDNCLNVYIEREDYRQYIPSTWKGCTIIPIVGKIEAYGGT